MGVKEIYGSMTSDNTAQFDYIANDLAWLVISEKARRVFEQVNLGVHEFIPLIDEKTNSIIGYLVHCMNIIDAFDLDNSVCNSAKYVIDGKEHEQLIVLKYAVKENKVEQYDMFKLCESNIPYFISERLRSKMKKAKLKGFDYLRIKVC